jgi:hypothetical protein
MYRKMVKNLKVLRDRYIMTKKKAGGVIMGECKKENRMKSFETGRDHL